MLDFETSKYSKSEVLKSKVVDNYFFMEKYITSEGAVSHNVLCYQQLSNSLPNKFFVMLKIVLSNYQ